MIPLALLALDPFFARDAGLSWRFEGTVEPRAGGYDLVGKDLRGEVAFYRTASGRFDAEELYRRDTQRTKEADAAKAFAHVRAATTLAEMPAIASEQRYFWNGVAVASRCVYCAQGDRAWVVRLWWPPASKGAKAAEAFLRSARRLS